MKQAVLCAIILVVVVVGPGMIALYSVVESQIPVLPHHVLHTIDLCGSLFCHCFFSFPLYNIYCTSELKTPNNDGIEAKHS